MFKTAKGFVVWILVMPSLLVGCQSIGPKVLFSDRYYYNKIMNTSNSQELLLNMVRLRYNESTMVLKIGNISGSTSQQVTGTLLGTYNIADVFDGKGLASGTAGATFTDNPIISYTPLDDQSFTQAFLRSLELADINLLLQSAWSISRVMRVGLQQVGYAYNAPSAARPTTSHVPKYQTFLDMVTVLRQAQIKDALTSYYNKNDTIEELTLVIRKDYRFNAKETAVLKKAGIVVYDHKIVLTNRPAPHKVFVITRSMQGILNYLSKGVVVPEEDAKSKILSETFYSNGARFNWQKVLNGIMEIHHSSQPSRDAYLSVYYRNRWYYVKDTDSDSKQTLILLANMSGLIQGGKTGKNLGPTLARTV